MVVLPVITFVVGVGLAWAVLRRGKQQPAPADPRVAELSELAGGLAHELRNPLSTIMINLQLLAETLKDGHCLDEHDQRRCLLKIETIRKESDRLRRLLDDFLQTVGPGELTTQPVELNQVVERLVQFYAPKAEVSKVRLHIKLHPDPLTCQLDEQLIEQALLNLVINATEATPDGGEVIVRTWREGGRTAGVEISDTGPGIPLEIQDKIFRPFFSTKKGGTGLGLSTTQRIVTQHGGRLDLHSQPGQGVGFTIRLPLAQGGKAHGKIRDSRG